MARKRKLLSDEDESPARPVKKLIPTSVATTLQDDTLRFQAQVGRYSVQLDLQILPGMILSSYLREVDCLNNLFLAGGESISLPCSQEDTVITELQPPKVGHGTLARSPSQVPLNPQAEKARRQDVAVVCATHFPLHHSGLNDSP